MPGALHHNAGTALGGDEMKHNHYPILLHCSCLVSYDGNMRLRACGLLVCEFDEWSKWWTGLEICPNCGRRITSDYCDCVLLEKA